MPDAKEWLEKNLRMQGLIGVWQIEDEFEFAHNAFEVTTTKTDMELQDLILEFNSGPCISLAVSEWTSLTIIQEFV